MKIVGFKHANIVFDRITLISGEKRQSVKFTLPYVRITIFINFLLEFAAIDKNGYGVPMTMTINSIRIIR